MPSKCEALSSNAIAPKKKKKKESPEEGSSTASTLILTPGLGFSTLDF
jgi:hypothetical protein